MTEAELISNERITKPLSLAKDKSSLAGKLHSITFYMPKDKNKFMTDALKERAKSEYGFSPTGKVSKLIRSLIEKDLKSCGLLFPDGECNVAALENLKKNNVLASK